MQPNSLTTLALTHGMIDAEAGLRAEQQEVLAFTAGFNALGRSRQAALLALARTLGEHYALREDCHLLNHLFGTVTAHLIRVLLLRSG